MPSWTLEDGSSPLQRCGVYTVMYTRNEDTYQKCDEENLRRIYCQKLKVDKKNPKILWTDDVDVRNYRSSLYLTTSIDKSTECFRLATREQNTYGAICRVAAKSLTLLHCVEPTQNTFRTVFIKTTPSALDRCRLLLNQTLSD